MIIWWEWCHHVAPHELIKLNHQTFVTNKIKDTIYNLFRWWVLHNFKSSLSTFHNLTPKTETSILHWFSFYMIHTIQYQYILDEPLSISTIKLSSTSIFFKLMAFCLKNVSNLHRAFSTGSYRSHRQQSPASLLILYVTDDQERWRDTDLSCRFQMGFIDMHPRMTKGWRDLFITSDAFVHIPTVSL